MVGLKVGLSMYGCQTFTEEGWYNRLSSSCKAGWGWQIKSSAGTDEKQPSWPLGGGSAQGKGLPGAVVERHQGAQLPSN